MRKLCVDVRVVSVTLLQACNSGGGIFVVRHLLASSNIINCYNKKMSKPWNPQWNGWVNGWMKLNIHRTAILHKVGCLVGHIFSLKTPTEVIMHLLKPHLVMTTFEVWLLFARNFYPEPFFSSQLTNDWGEIEIEIQQKKCKNNLKHGRSCIAGRYIFTIL